MYVPARASHPHRGQPVGLSRRERNIPCYCRPLGIGEIALLAIGVVLMCVPPAMRLVERRRGPDSAAKPESPSPQTREAYRRIQPVIRARIHERITSDSIPASSFGDYRGGYADEIRGAPEVSAEETAIARDAVRAYGSDAVQELVSNFYDDISTRFDHAMRDLSMLHGTPGAGQQLGKVIGIAQEGYDAWEAIRDQMGREGRITD